MRFSLEINFWSESHLQGSDSWKTGILKKGMPAWKVVLIERISS